MSKIVDLTVCGKSNEEINEAPFVWDQKKGAFKVSQNISVKYYSVFDSVPAFFPTNEDGFASVVKISTSLIESSDKPPCFEKFPTTYKIDKKYSVDSVSSGNYSVRYKSERKPSSICFFGRKVPAIRKTGECGGVKACGYSVEFCSNTHQGLDACFKDFEIIDEGKDNESYIENENNLARKVFWFGQAQYNCPEHSQDTGFVGEKDSYFMNQRREPIWVFKSGKEQVHDDDITSIRADYLGCSHFMKGVTKCPTINLPAHLQNCDSRLVRELIRQARSGNFPEPSDEEKNRCRPYSNRTHRKHCSSSFHDFEAVPLVQLKCKVKYHTFRFVEESYQNWVIIVGVGKHSHMKPPLIPSTTETKRTVSSVLEVNPNATTVEICRRIESETKKRAPIDSIRKYRRSIKQRSSIYGKNCRT